MKQMMSLRKCLSSSMPNSRSTYLKHLLSRFLYLNADWHPTYLILYSFLALPNSLEPMSSKIFSIIADIEHLNLVKTSHVTCNIKSWCFIWCTPSFTDCAKLRPLCASFTDTYLVLAIVRGFTKGVSMGVI